MNFVNFHPLMTKGQIILKGLFGILKFSKKTNKRICFFNWNELVHLFLREFEDIKKFFRNYLTFNTLFGNSSPFHLIANE